MVYRRFSCFLRSLTGKGSSPDILALSFCLGVYIAFSPFPGFHTWMVIAFSWLFALNMPVVFAVSCAINNPWTMIPVYTMDYCCGDIILRSFFNGSGIQFNPVWMQTVNVWLSHYVGLPDLSLWSFLLGGNILGLGGSIVMYPIIKKVFVRLHVQSNKEMV